MADNGPKLDARKAMEFVRTSKLVDLKMPVGDMLAEVSKLDQVAGYAIAWEKYVLVVAKPELEQISTPEVRR